MLNKIGLFPNIIDKIPGRLPNTRIQNVTIRHSLSPSITAENVFNLGSDKRLEILFSLSMKNKDELSTIARLIAALLKKGIVGYEYLDIKNRPYKSFLSTRIGDHSLYGAKLYRRNIRNKNILV